MRRYWARLLDLSDLPDDLADLYVFFLRQIQVEVEDKGLAVPVTSPAAASRFTCRRGRPSISGCWPCCRARWRP